MSISGAVVTCCGLIKDLSIQKTTHKAARVTLRNVSKRFNSDFFQMSAITMHGQVEGDETSSEDEEALASNVLVVFVTLYVFPYPNGIKKLA